MSLKTKSPALVTETVHVDKYQSVTGFSGADEGRTSIDPIAAENQLSEVVATAISRASTDVDVSGAAAIDAAAESLGSVNGNTIRAPGES